MTTALPRICRRGLWAVLLLLAGCSDKASQPVAIFDIENRTEGMPVGLQMEEALLYRRLEMALTNSSMFHLVPTPEKEAWRARLVLQAIDERELAGEDASRWERSLTLDMTLARKRPDGEESRLHATAEVGQVQPADKERTTGFLDPLGTAMERVVELAEIQLRAATMPEEKVGELLADDDEAYRLQALRALRERRLPRLGPRVVEMLRDPNAEVALEAVGVLVAWKEQSAVVPIIRSGQGKDILYQSQVLTALGEIGGPVARGYLFTVAAGHLSAHLRNLAREQLEKLQRQERKGNRAGASEPTAGIP